MVGLIGIGIVGPCLASCGRGTRKAAPRSSCEPVPTPSVLLPHRRWRSARASLSPPRYEASTAKQFRSAAPAWNRKRPPVQSRWRPLLCANVSRWNQAGSMASGPKEARPRILPPWLAAADCGAMWCGFTVERASTTQAFRALDETTRPQTSLKLAATRRRAHPRIHWPPPLAPCDRGFPPPKGRVGERGRPGGGRWLQALQLAAAVPDLPDRWRRWPAPQWLAVTQGIGRHVTPSPCPPARVRHGCITSTCRSWNALANSPTPDPFCWNGWHTSSSAPGLVFSLLSSTAGRRRRLSFFFDFHRRSPSAARHQLRFDAAQEQGCRPPTLCFPATLAAGLYQQKSTRRLLLILVCTRTTTRRSPSPRSRFTQQNHRHRP